MRDRPLFGCGKAETTEPWTVESVGGPLEVRPMPLPSQVASDYEAWIKASAGPRVLLYEVSLTNAASQMAYTHRIDRSDSPLGSPWITIISFRYAFSSNEVATFHTSVNGKKDTAYLRVGPNPLKLFVEPIKVRSVPIPEFGITAVQGIPRGPIPASVPSGVP